jgi:hypothetical protein
MPVCPIPYFNELTFWQPDPDHRYLTMTSSSDMGRQARSSGGIYGRSMLKGLSVSNTAVC